MSRCHRWQGQVEHAQEWVCTAKTQKKLYQELEEAIKEVHTYDVPEILATEIVEGIQSYENWITEETSKQEVATSQQI